MDEKLETWQNLSQGTVVVWKRGVKGEFEDKLVGPGQKFAIARDDRIYNMDQAANNELDIFSNGTLSPVRLLDGTEDAKEFASNPNLISGSEMKSMFKGHWKTFESKIGQITNANTLQRLLEVAEEVDASVRQAKLIQARIAEVSGSAPVGERTAAAVAAGTPAAVTPH